MAITKTNLSKAEKGSQGEVVLARGQGIAMRLWDGEMPTRSKEPSAHPYEVVGYVIAGRAELEIEGEVVALGPGDSWHVPANTRHVYRILDPFTAVEAFTLPKAGG